MYTCKRTVTVLLLLYFKYTHSNQPDLTIQFEDVTMNFDGSNATGFLSCLCSTNYSCVTKFRIRDKAWESLDTEQEHASGVVPNTNVFSCFIDNITLQSECSRIPRKPPGDWTIMYLLLDNICATTCMELMWNFRINNLTVNIDHVHSGTGNSCQDVVTSSLTSATSSGTTAINALTNITTQNTLTNITTQDTLTNITTPDTLTNITTPETLTNITTHDTLTNITTPDTLTNITTPATLTNITTPDTLTNITTPDTLTNITTPATLTNITTHDTLTNITTPDTLTNITTPDTLTNITTNILNFTTTERPTNNTETVAPTNITTSTLNNIPTTTTTTSANDVSTTLLVAIIVPIVIGVVVIIFVSLCCVILHKRKQRSLGHRARFREYFNKETLKQETTSNYDVIDFNSSIRKEVGLKDSLNLKSKRKIGLEGITSSNYNNILHSAQPVDTNKENRKIGEEVLTSGVSGEDHVEDDDKTDEDVDNTDTENKQSDVGDDEDRNDKASEIKASEDIKCTHSDGVHSKYFSQNEQFDFAVTRL